MSWDFSKDGDLIEAASGIIANVGSRNGKGWGDQDSEWQRVAHAWMQAFGAAHAPSPSEESGE